MAERRQEAHRLMLTFAEETGLVGTGQPRRYLWTDAYAVCNFLTLWRVGDDVECLQLARQLVQAVHTELGRHRSDDSRTGWLSGLADAEAARHPTAGGLRIGKPLPERALGAPVDERLEWERDGQYFHYLTKWAHALNAMARATGELDYRRWASELMLVAWRRFQAPGEPARLHWKMRIDLSEPLVSGASPHDPLDGAITCLSLIDPALPDLAAELAAVAANLFPMCDREQLLTTDALGIGGLLFDATRLAQLAEVRPLQLSTELVSLLEAVLAAAAQGTAAYARSAPLSVPAEQRLAFRELGMVIGFAGLNPLRAVCPQWPGSRAPLETLFEFQTLSDRLLDLCSHEGAAGHGRALP